MTKHEIYHGDCLERLRDLPDNSVDVMITDPPYGLSAPPDIDEMLAKWEEGEKYEHKGKGFMSAKWDSFVPGPAMWKEALRVLKPGSLGAVRGSTDRRPHADRIGDGGLRDRGPRSVDLWFWIP